MTVLFIEGFDHYSTNADLLKGGWLPRTINDQHDLVLSSGRRGGGAMQVGGSLASLGRTIPEGSTFVIGVAIKFPSVLDAGWVWILSRSNQTAAYGQIGLWVDAAGILSYRVGNSSVVLASSTNAIAAGSWYYVEGKVVIADSGSYELRVNGSSTGWIPYATGDTRYDTTYATANSIDFGSDARDYGNPPLLLLFDDIYILDGTAPNNDFLGDCRVDYCRAAANGASNPFSRSAGSANYECVDEATYSETDYTYSNTAAQQELYECADLPHTPVSIFAVSPWVPITKSDAGSRGAKILTRSGGTTYQSSTKYPSAGTYRNESVVYDTDPKTSAAWIQANVNALQIGAEVV